ncbi:ABC transporter ATP-binding protein [Xanthobacter flavus]|uniref:ABC transporter ATP-binding protein n=1 Tax=Xanthobacter flavus TaxID=281 RepID=UPI00372801AC
MSIISMIRKPVPVPLREAGEVEIDVRDVTIAFERDGGELVPAVDRVSFQVRRGEFICLLGPSGCGKSTLLNAVAGFETPYEGEVVVGTKVVTGPGPDRGVVFQQPRLFPWKSVRANVAHGPRMAGKSCADAGAIADELIEMVGLSRSAKALPHTLSGGMQQRVAIARALANRPNILLMDEPFGALDAQTRTVMQEGLLRLWAQLDTTILFVTHDIDEAVLLADRVLVMSAGPGRIVRDLAVDLPRPRTIETTLGARFQALRRECLDLIRQQSQKAFEGTHDA